MLPYPTLFQWRATIAQNFPALSQPQVMGLALWSLGMMLVQSCSLSAVANMLTPLLGQSFNTLRERLRDTYREASAKSGKDRAQLDVTVCWTPWLTWILKGWEGNQLAIALDATNLGAKFVVLAVSVVYRGCAVPVAWKIVKAGQTHPWKPEWIALLKQFHGHLPAKWTVIVLADRGLYAKWLYVAIVALKWHPFLRVNTGGSFRPQGMHNWQSFGKFAPSKTSHWEGQGTAWRSPQLKLNCTLLAYWGETYEDPWLVLTDLAPESANACWYGLRAWIEQGFKRTKSAGWQWQNTRMDNPERAERLWMPMAIATWWLLSVGGDAEAQSDSFFTIAACLSTVGSARRQGKGWRIVGIFHHGWCLIMAALLHQHLLPIKPGKPEPWPTLHWVSPATSISDLEAEK